MSPAESPEVVPCRVVPQVGPKRAAMVPAQPSWSRGVRHPTPTSGGTWNAPPVPTSTVELFVNFAPPWHPRAPSVRPVEEHLARGDGAGVDPGRRRRRRNRLDPALQRRHLRAVERLSRHAPCVDVVHERFHVGLVARPMVRRGPGDRAAERQSPPRVAVERPGVAVVSALGVARQRRRSPRRRACGRWRAPCRSFERPSTAEWRRPGDLRRRSRAAAGRPRGWPGLSSGRGWLRWTRSPPRSRPA